MNARADASSEPLLDAAEVHGRFRQRNAVHAAHLRVGGQQQIKLALQRNRERVFDVRILPGVLT